MFNPHQAQQLVAQVAGASDKLNEYGDRVGEGDHTFALSHLTYKDTESSGSIVTAGFVVMESSNPAAHKPWDYVEVAYFLTSGEKWKREKDATRCKQLIAALTQTPIENAQKIMEQMGALMQPHQPGRGLLVRVTGRTQPPRVNKKTGEMGKSWVKITFLPHEGLTPEMIAKARGLVDQRYPLAQMLAAPAQHQVPVAPSWGQQPPPDHPVNAPGYGQPVPPPQAGPGHAFGAPPPGYPSGAPWAPQSQPWPPQVPAQPPTQYPTYQPGQPPVQPPGYFPPAAPAQTPPAGASFPPGPLSGLLGR